MKKAIFFSKDLLNVMLVFADKDTVKFDIGGHEVELDKWKVETLIQLLTDFDKQEMTVMEFWDNWIFYLFLIWLTWKAWW